MKNTRKGFTLIELVIVVAIIGILALMIIPNFGAVTGNAKQKTFIANAKAITTAIGEFTMANDGEIPTSKDQLTGAAASAAGKTEKFIDKWPDGNPADSTYWVADGTKTDEDKGKVQGQWTDDKGKVHKIVNGVYQAP